MENGLLGTGLGVHFISRISCVDPRTKIIRVRSKVFDKSVPARYDYTCVMIHAEVSELADEQD